MPNTTTRPIRILSLFDGCGALRHALDKMGVPDEMIDYSRAEINEYSNSIFEKNYPNSSTNYGDVRLITASQFTSDTVPDLIVSSSPCVQLSSISPNSHLQLKGAESSLFYEFIRILNELRAKFPEHKIDHLQENVSSMKRASLLEFSTALKTSYFRHDSKHDSPAKRDRCYWASFSLQDFYKYPIQRKKLKDILENGYTDMPEDTGMCILSTDPTTGINGNGLKRSLNKKLSTPVFVSPDYIGLSKEDKLELFHQRVGKSVYIPIDGEPVFRNGQYRFLSNLEKERALGFSDNYTQGVSESQRKVMLGKTFNVNSMMRIMSCYSPVSGLLDR